MEQRQVGWVCPLFRRTGSGREAARASGPRTALYKPLESLRVHSEITVVESTGNDQSGLTARQLGTAQFGW